MLVSEKKLSSSEGILIWPADRGLGFQAAGAFQRLGSRLTGVAGTEPQRKIPNALPLAPLVWVEGSTPDSLFGQQPSFKTLVWSAHPHLSWNESPVESDVAPLLATLRWAEARDPDFHAIVVLPQNTARELLIQIRETSARATLLLSPASFGFRDDALFDHAFTTLRDKPGLLEKPLNHESANRKIQGVSYADLAAHLVVCPHNDAVIGKNIWIEGVSWTPQEWLKVFSESFRPEVGRLERWASKLSFEDALPASLIERLSRGTPSSTEVSPTFEFVVHAESEVFPSPPAHLRRSLEQHSRAIQRYPDLELVFTPGRAP